MTDWQELLLGDFAPFRYGKGLPEERRDQCGGFPVFGSNGVVGHHSIPYTSGSAVVIGRKGSAGAVHYSETPCWPIDTTFFVTDPDKDGLRFKYYVLKSLDLGNLNSDSAVPGLNRDAAHAQPLLVPPLDEQRRIARILGALDDKIELNRKMNQTLEVIARTLFKSWFVDFDPVRAKSEGRDTGLPAHIADLFPSSFVDSELGEIPEGWSVCGLLEMADLLSGGTPSTSNADYWDGSIGWVSAKDVVSAAGGYLLATDRKITELGVAHSATRILPKNTTILTARGTVGANCLLASPMAMNQTNYGLRGKGILGDYYINGLVKSVVNELRQSAYGTIFDTITTRTLSGIYIVLPNSSICDIFEGKMSTLYARSLHNLEETHTLTELRDILLPRLLSGELRVPAAEEEVEEAVGSEDFTNTQSRTDDERVEDSMLWNHNAPRFTAEVSTS